jgi:hypothetical protein
MTTIDFTNAFGSVPHKLIMSTMRQQNFPEWTRVSLRFERSMSRWLTAIASELQWKVCKELKKHWVIQDPGIIKAVQQERSGQEMTARQNL